MGLKIKGMISYIKDAQDVTDQSLGKTEQRKLNTE